MRERRAALGAAGLAVGAYLVALAVRRGYPFGHPPPAGSRLAEQVVPMHAHLWDLLHGHGGGDLLLNWNSGYGVPFLPDLLTQLPNPCSLLVLLVPRAQVWRAVFLATLLSIGLGAALMTRFLARLRPGPGWQRALLGGCYALGAWTLLDGVGQPAWLWGLVALPLLCLAFDRCLRRTGWPLGTAAVALAWYGDFYTAAPATLAAVLVLVLRVALDRRPARERLRVLGRAAGMATVGIAAAAPVLWVTYRAGLAAAPALVPHPQVPGFSDYLARLLPGGLAPRRLPDVFVGVLPLLLAAALPFHRAVRPAERVAWPAALLLLTAAFVWRPTLLLWHVANAPEGNPYRATFVLGALLTMAAWVCLAERPGAGALAGGALLLVLLAVSAHGRAAVGAVGWVLLAGGVPVTAAALVAARRRPRVAAAVLGCAVLAGAVLAAYQVQQLRGQAQQRGRQAVPGQAAPGGSQATARDRLLAAGAESAWPGRRTEPGPQLFTGNDPMLLGGQGGDYRSDYLPDATAQALHGLGAGWLQQGRQTLGFADPVGQALFAVGASLGPDLTVRSAPAAPLVTVHAFGPADTSSVWARRQLLLGATVYQTPPLVPGTGPTAPTDHGRSGWSLPSTPPGSEGTVLTASCTPGRLAYLYAPYLSGQLSWPDGELTAAGQQDETALPVLPLGPVPADGVVRVTVRVGIATQVPAEPFGCLDPAALTAAVDRLHAQGPTRVRAGGHTVAADLPPGSSGTALLAVPAVPGWQCAVDGGPAAPARSVEGLLAVPLGTGATHLTCSFHPPGLLPGLWVTAGAAVVWATVTGWTWWRRRRNGGGAAG
ncbi:YfhO family protein [Kitasatospora sp. LaBMicrA B282]|uniref:YfhO family protein n=1 Tax=Kitasatospora sp. LaBMicrA B282 TaxID=3420949 RepID=UPI003D0B1F5F